MSVPSLQSIAATQLLNVLFTPMELKKLRKDIKKGTLDDQTLHDLLLHHKNVSPNLVQPTVHAIMHYNPNMILVQIHNVYGLSPNTTSVIGPQKRFRWHVRNIMAEAKRGRIGGKDKITWNDSPYGRVLSDVFTAHGEPLPSIAEAEDLFQLEILDRLADIEICTRFIDLAAAVYYRERDGHGRWGQDLPFDYSPFANDNTYETWEGVEVLLNQLGTPTEQIPDSPVPNIPLIL